jgi:hypothetical protein
MSLRSDRDLLYHFLAPAFLILTPFVSFITHNDYSYTAPEFWICLAGLAAIALMCGLAGIVGGWPVRVLLTAVLLCLWVDLQFDWLDDSKRWPELRVLGVFALALILAIAVRRHLSRVVAAVFATMLGSTVVLAAVDGAVSRDWDPAAAPEPTRQTRSQLQLPVLVHFIFDEHIGIEGVPKDVPHGREMRDFFREFFERYGFRVFARAYSRYANTYTSLPNLVNFSVAPVDGAFIPGGKSWRAAKDAARPYALLSNRYFELLGREGYRIHVYRPDFIDFCGASAGATVQCASQEVIGWAKATESADISVIDKASMIYRRFAKLSALETPAGARYRQLRRVLQSAGWTLPNWWFDEGVLGPNMDLALFGDVAAAVTRASPGDMFLLHLLIPHHPYFYDAMCDLRPMHEWEMPGPPGSLLNDRESRARRYGLYLEQMRCLYRKLDAMFQAWQKAGIFDAVTIVLHGDHGSRIYQHRPDADSQHKLTDTDYLDAFSTLFAVKGPQHPPGYDHRVAALEQLLGEVVGEETGDDDSHAEPYVFLSSGTAKPMLRQPFPGLREAVTAR